MFMATSFFGICFLGFVFGDSLPILTFSEIFSGDVNYPPPKGSWLPLNGSPDWGRRNSAYDI